MVERCCTVNPFEDGTALGALRTLPSFEEALSRLVYLVEHSRPCGIVRGPAGCGKTPLLESVIRELSSEGHECGVIDLHRSSAAEFAWRLAGELGTAPPLTDRFRCWRLVEDAIQGRALAGRVTVLVLDHLDEQGDEMRSELRRLMAIVEASAGWGTVLGAARNTSTDIDSFVRDYSELRIELEPLGFEETAAFLHHVVEMTGCCPFDDDAVQTLHQSSRGVLRNLMTLSRLAIIAQAAEGAPRVTGEIVRLAAAEVASPPPSRQQADRTALLAAAD